MQHNILTIHHLSKWRAQYSKIDNTVSAEPYIIIAQSARALAQSAWASKLPVHTIDCFADLETKAYAQTSAAYAAHDLFTRQTLEAALSPFMHNGTAAQFVTGSGFESDPDLVNILADWGDVIGNSSEVIRSLTDPVAFFSMLDELQVPHPETIYQAPDNREGLWLYKKIAGMGGGHIGYYNANKVQDYGYYWQRWCPGRSLSTIFLADGRAQILGINAHLSSAIPARPFLYHGAIGQIKLPAERIRWIQQAIDKIIQAIGLRGLCSVDFIAQENGQYFLLEVNPRPPATLDLYPFLPCFSAHINACKGELEAIPSMLNHEKHHGHFILYAKAALTMPQISYPDWLSDCPPPGSYIQKFDPICTVVAQAKEPQITRNILQDRCQQIMQALYATAV